LDELHQVMSKNVWGASRDMLEKILLACFKVMHPWGWEEILV